MTTSIYNRDQQQQISTASVFAGRLQLLTEKGNQLALAQTSLENEYASLLTEVEAAARGDPELLLQLQRELSGQQQQLPALPSPPPHVALEIGGDFLAGAFDEDLLPQPAVFTDFSPLFGPIITSGHASTPFALDTLDDIPALALAGPALSLPDSFTINPSTLDLVAHVPASNSSGESSFGSPFSASPPTSYTCSPIFSPFDACTTNLGSYTSPSSAPFHSFGAAGSSFSSNDSAWPSQPASLSAAPPALFPVNGPPQEGATTSLATFEAQLDALLLGSVAASLPPLPVAPVSQVPLARVPSQAGRAKPHRQASLDSSIVRFSPMAPPPVEFGGHYRQASATPSVSSLLASPDIKPLALGRQGSTGRRTRTTRTFKEDPCLVVEKNTKHVFAVHISSKNKIEANESPVTRLFLDESTLDPSSPFGQAVLLGEPYSPASFRLDCAHHSRYTFYTASRCAWVVTFSLSGPTVVPASATDGPAPSRSTRYTFLHFLPSDIVVTPSEPIGSIPWWRLQECRGSHAGYPGTGAWTARYDGVGAEDADAEKRRPARIYSHFAKCCGKGCEEQGEWSLMKLAKAMKVGK
ncbi:hypothetical protein JCM11251_001339 [Rhodosporidiobolus azoricus]